MFHDLEDQNLSMIQNGQDMEEALDDMKVHAKVTEERLNKEVNFLIDQERFKLRISSNLSE